MFLLGAGGCAALTGCAQSHVFSVADAGPVEPADAALVAEDAGMDTGAGDLGLDDSGPGDAGQDAFDACAAGCDDGDECTDDLCEAGRCVFVPRASECEFFRTHVIRLVSGAHSVAATDIDQDGDLDLAVTAHNSRFYAWEENVEGTGLVWTQHVLLAGEAGRQLVPVDFDGDGDDDLIGGGGRDDPYPIRLFENLHGDASAFATYQIGDRELQDLDVGDLDGDGRLDVLAVSQWDQPEVFALFGRDGGFEHRVLADVGLHPQYVRMVDLDADGRLDVLTAFFGLVWLEQRDDGFTSHDLDVYSATSADPVDVDGDGDLDVLAVGDSRVVWVENRDGRMGTTRVHQVANDLDYAWSVHGADMDADGDVDILAASRWTDEFVLYLNQGHDRWDRLVLMGDTHDAFEIIAADIDGDGDLDAVGTATVGGGFYWWENLGRL
ncbi:MAG: VCBS repeat-containing protein [Sandaracinaceae bacterium]|nr:VCBS repeat-containing protein [Sandaracinaceae bacterium]